MKLAAVLLASLELQIQFRPWGVLRESGNYNTVIIEASSMQPARELATMARAILALLYTGANIQLLTDDDHALNLATNVQLSDAAPAVQEQSKQHTAANIVRLGILRRSILWSFGLLASAVIASLLLRHFIPAPTKQCQALLGVASVFFFAWATLGRLGWAGQSHGGNSVIERLDDRIFKFLYWLGMFVGTLALI